MKIVSTTDNYLVLGVQLSIGVPLDVDPSHAPDFLCLPGVVEVETELPKSSKPALPIPPVTLEKD